MVQLDLNSSGYDENDKKIHEKCPKENSKKTSLSVFAPISNKEPKKNLIVGPRICIKVNRDKSSENNIIVDKGFNVIQFKNCEEILKNKNKNLKDGKEFKDNAFVKDLVQEHTFTADAIFNEHSTERDLFEDLGVWASSRAFSGESVSVLCFGDNYYHHHEYPQGGNGTSNFHQTGKAGNLIWGHSSQFEKQQNKGAEGFIERVMNCLVQAKALDSNGTDLLFTLSAVELCNERAFDLLTSEPFGSSVAGSVCHHGLFGSVFNGVVHLPFSSSAEIRELLSTTRRARGLLQTSLAISGNVVITIGVQRMRGPELVYSSLKIITINDMVDVLNEDFMKKSIADDNSDTEKKTTTKTTKTSNLSEDGAELNHKSTRVLKECVELVHNETRALFEDEKKIPTQNEKIPTTAVTKSQVDKDEKMNKENEQSEDDRKYIETQDNENEQNNEDTQDTEIKLERKESFEDIAKSKTNTPTKTNSEETKSDDLLGHITEASRQHNLSLFGQLLRTAVKSRENPMEKASSMAPELSSSPVRRKSAPTIPIPTSVPYQKSILTSILSEVLNGIERCGIILSIDGRIEHRLTDIALCSFVKKMRNIRSKKHSRVFHLPRLISSLEVEATNLRNLLQRHFAKNVDKNNDSKKNNALVLANNPPAVCVSNDNSEDESISDDDDEEINENLGTSSNKDNDEKLENKGEEEVNTEGNENETYDDDADKLCEEVKISKKIDSNISNIISSPKRPVMAPSLRRELTQRLSCARWLREHFSMSEHDWLERAAFLRLKRQSAFEGRRMWYGNWSSPTDSMPLLIGLFDDNSINGQCLWSLMPSEGSNESVLLFGSGIEENSSNITEPASEISPNDELKDKIHHVVMKMGESSSNYCKIVYKRSQNPDHLSSLELYPQKNTVISVNGNTITSTSVPLYHGDRIVVGGLHCFQILVNAESDCRLVNVEEVRLEALGLSSLNPPLASSLPSSMWASFIKHCIDLTEATNCCKKLFKTLPNFNFEPMIINGCQVSNTLDQLRHFGREGCSCSWTETRSDKHASNDNITAANHLMGLLQKNDSMSMSFHAKIMLDLPVDFVLECCQCQFAILCQRLKHICLQKTVGSLKDNSKCFDPFGNIVSSENVKDEKNDNDLPTNEWVLLWNLTNDLDIRWSYDAVQLMMKNCGSVMADGSEPQNTQFDSLLDPDLQNGVLREQHAHICALTAENKKLIEQLNQMQNQLHRKDKELEMVRSVAKISDQSHFDRSMSSPSPDEDSQVNDEKNINIERENNESIEEKNEHKNTGADHESQIGEQQKQQQQQMQQRHDGNLDASPRQDRMMESTASFGLKSIIRSPGVFAEPDTPGLNLEGNRGLRLSTSDLEIPETEEKDSKDNKEEETSKKSEFQKGMHDILKLATNEKEPTQKPKRFSFFNKRKSTAVSSKAKFSINALPTDPVSHFQNASLPKSSQPRTVIPPPKMSNPTQKYSTHTRSKLSLPASKNPSASPSRLQRPILTQKSNVDNISSTTSDIEKAQGINKSPTIQVAPVVISSDSNPEPNTRKPRVSGTKRSFFTGRTKAVAFQRKKPDPLNRRIISSHSPSILNGQANHRIDMRNAVMTPTIDISSPAAAKPDVNVSSFLSDFKTFAEALRDSN
eukprot:TRINITY_DN1938_c2_g1_i2.p1 TRINITY_DN1938_c2_g1~~TRINITY_DN1938_c2_g1_i2.p1  ORF type:complete len:1878 (-),score=546.19 TRINITY_DN1938_c2_g1_i2:154-5046(-)